MAPPAGRPSDRGRAAMATGQDWWTAAMFVARAAAAAPQGPPSTDCQQGLLTPTGGYGGG